MPEDSSHPGLELGDTNVPAPESATKTEMVDTQEAPSEKENASSTQKDAPVEHEYPGPWSLAAIMIALYFAMFLVALVSLCLFTHFR